MDPLLIKKWSSELPNLNNLITDRDFKLESVFPPDSIHAWSTIYTGLKPEEHGILDSIDYLSMKKTDSLVDINIYKGKTFWDILSKHNKKVCVINPFLAYPPWHVNGLMVSGPVFEGGSSLVYPEGSFTLDELPELGGMVDFPNADELTEFIIRSKALTEKLHEFAFKNYKKDSWDLFFVCFLTLDRIKHFLWRYTDETDPTYPGVNPHDSAVKDFYKIFDRVIGEYLKDLDNGTELVVLSDHGHGMRCTKVVHINELLRKEGYLKTRGSSSGKLLRRLVETLKVKALSIGGRFGLADQIYVLAKMIPGKQRKALKKVDYLIDRENSLAYVADLGTANPYGGITVNKNLPEEEHEKVRERIIYLLEGLSDNENNKKTVLWICKREQMILDGEFKEKYPDILFELDAEYGISWNLYAPLFDINPTHSKISGGHRRQGIFISTNSNGKRPERLEHVKDWIVSTVLT